MRTYFTRSLACFALATAATPAMAEEITISVPYGDLDLTSDDAVAVLRSRLADAAAEVCAPDRWAIGNSVTADCEYNLVRKGMAEVRTRRAAALAELP
jgi:UrcA family protein